MATYSKSLTVAAKSVYTLTMNNIPTGSSVTPVNDIQTWLHCADIWSKTYTTINQVLADASTLQALIASTNAVDYMVRSTNWASSVCANAIAMTYIGNNDYCANKLLANSTWLTAICNSAYFESVLNVKVPTMTSNTTPSGECFGQVVGSGGLYMAFDGNQSTVVYQSQVVGMNIGYKFTQKVRVLKISIYQQEGTQNFSFQGSNDGTNYTTLKDNVTGNLKALNSFNITNSNKYQYYQIRSNVAGVNSRVNTLQFYGRA